jgi:hypothetical protein
LNESSTESGGDDESGHDDSARVLDEVAEISFTGYNRKMGIWRGFTWKIIGAVYSRSNLAEVGSSDCRVFELCLDEVS